MGKRTGIILAWDSSRYRKGKDYELIEELSPYVDMVKVGLETMSMSAHEGDFSVADAIWDTAVNDCGLGVMWDAKVHEVSTTVDRTIRNLLACREGIRFLTIHAAMSDGALNLANAACAQANVRALAVTVLTDLDSDQCKARFLPDNTLYAGNFVPVLVENLARNSHRIGIRGFVCSGLEVPIIREALGDDVNIVTPAIRPAWADVNDQKRVMTPSEAAKAGADYIVVGRPILQPPSGMTPVDAAKRIRAELDEASASA